MTVLIVGQRAFTAQGFAARLRENGYVVIETSAATWDEDPAIQSCSPDALVDFGFLRDVGVEENVARIERLIDYVQTHQVKQVIHISSMSVYPINAVQIDAQTAIETDFKLRGAYSSVKIAQELVHRKMMPHTYALTIVRPGVVIASVGKRFICHTGGVWFRLFARFGILLGEDESTLPIVHRNLLHQRLLDWLNSPPPLGMIKTRILATLRTKGWFAQQILQVHYVVLPKFIVRLLAKLLSAARAAQLLGLYRKYELISTDLAEEGVPT